MWYREGTITFTQGSNTLVGAGTAWNVTANGVLPGMIVIGPDNKLYEIKRVISDTNIVLSEPYTGETQSEVPCRIITTYEGDLTQFSARFTALMSRMSADSKSMRSWLTALDEVTIEREDGTEVAVKPLMQIVNEHNENVEWYKNNTDAIDAAGDKAREAAASAAAAAESANTAGEKASQASQSASAAASSQSAASASATAAKKSETNAAASQKSAATSASTATTKASEAATSARDAAASKEAAKSSETSAASSASNAASSATAAGNSAKAAKTSETNARSSETAAGQSASAAAGSKTAAASSASAASTSAGQASASATAAGKSAESAASSASTATTKAGQATEQASAAARSASAAKTSETNAKASETRAESSKTAAASSASSAASSASSASASKDEATRQASAAKGSATTASTKATEAAGSATAASQSKTAAESAATRAEAAADRAEEIADAVAMEDASLTTKGVVKLSSAVDSTSESLAATPKAVKAANDNANSRVPSNRKVNGKALTADITLTPKDIGTLNSVTMSFSGGAGWFKLATVTMPQNSSIVYIALIGGAGFNVGSPQQAGISELVLRAGNGMPKGITGALWKRTAVGLTNFAWINTSGDTYDIYVEIGNYATSVNIHWDCTANATVSIYTSPTYSASKPSSVTDGVVYTMYSTHQKPTPLDIGALPTTGGTVSGPLSVTGGLTGSLNGNASTATKLQTARSIGGVGFDGSANINLPGVNTTGNQNTTGNAATATKLQTARTIGGVSFDGTANINLPGVNTAGNQSTTGNAATATKLQTARTINGVKFDGSADITLTPANLDVYSKSEIDNKKGMRKYTFSAPANAVSGKWYPIVFRRSRGSTDELASRVVITTYSSAGGYAMNNCEFNGFVMPGGWSDRGSYAAGFFSIYSTAERAIHSIISSVKDDDLCSVFYVEARAFPIKIFAEEGLNVIVPTADYAVGQTTYKWGATDPLSESTNAQIILDFKNGRGYYCSHPFISSLSGNAATATKLQTARTIGGVAFDGSANINLPGVNTAGNQNTTGNAATATKLQTARNINGVKFDGSGDININTLVSRGRVTALSGSTQGTAGIQMYEAYNNGYPTAYGNILHMKGAGAIGEGEMLVGWSGTDGAHAPVYVRSRRDTSTANWSGWAQVYTTAHKPTAKDVGAAQTFSASYSTGAGNWTTAEFIAWLKERGAFEVPYWMMKGSWSYADNKIITDTGVGNICLAGAVIEVLGTEGAMTIRVTTPTTTTGGGIACAQFTYINHGSAYAPAWRRDYNTTLKPTAADVGALPISGGTMTGVLTLQNVSQPLKTQGGGILANDGNLYINKSGFAGWIDALFMKNSGGTMSGQLKIRSTDGLRIYDAAYGMIFRRSENNFYLIPTAKDQGENGDIGSLRPFYVDLTNGRVAMGNGAVVNGGLGLGVVNGLGGNSIVLGDNDTGFKQNGDGILDVYANSAHVFRFVNSTLQSLKPLSVTGDITSSAWVYANRFSINSGSGAWIDMRNQNVIFGRNAVSTSSAQALLRQDHADRKFFLGGLGNSQFGFYMINNSRTENGTDANAYLQNDGTWVCGGNGSFNDVYIRSDRRSKRNIRKIERALDKLDRIEGVLYEIQVCDRYEQSGGLIAQDVQNVQPELVTVDHNDQSGEPRLRLNYNGVIGMLVEAVKELREEVRELKAKM
ncbi:TPA: tail fiber domain-containing protein [Escherichia coli]|nr:tail fiber domain-containing protein [Escherichia coli]HCS5056920.1 tail fiber domain-containing protein [Escherichia coli]HCS5099705.1 tail fiber domain-containing protein [Escherichia coli]HCS5181484.1 tail fiber domain-containing protein [Escherichia coli]